MKLLRRTCTIAILFILFGFQSHAQMGFDGNLTVSVSNTVVNKYTALSADASVGDSQIAVSEVSELGSLSAGDLVLIIQMQGALIDNSNSANYGNITSYNGAGNHEMIYVDRIADNTGIADTIYFCSTLTYPFLTSGHTQVVLVPQYQNLAVLSGGSITAPSWNGITGGIVAVSVSGTCTLNGDIDVSGKGFRGGVRDNNTSGTGTIVSDFISNSSFIGAEKGESIVGYHAEYDALGGRYGRGAPANVGGGGLAHNSGGGGGANASNGNTWNGQGVMSTAEPSWSQAWALDPEFAIAGNQLSNSSGGGRAGYSYGSNNLNALTTPPGNSGWGGNSRQPNGGWGGRPL